MPNDLRKALGSDKAAQADAVVQSLFAGQVGQVEPVLNEVDA